MVFHSALIADDEEPLRHLLGVVLRDRGLDVRTVGSAEDALKELGARDYDLLITDVRMPGMDGLELVRAACRQNPSLLVVVMTAYGSHALAMEAMRAGAYDYLPKPFKPDDVLLVLGKAEERQRLVRENRRLRAELARSYRLENMVITSEAMQEVMRSIQKVAPQKTTVLIHGESGTGKELVARALHELSPRASLPFVAVNCGAIPSELLESELFGHVRGAFTDARRDKKGLVAEADGGTLFLDEIGELPLPLQVKLLRFLQEEEIRPVGDVRARRVDVRVVVATARDLPRAVEAGQFREDLFWRLNVVAVHLPALRDRSEDVATLAAHFLKRFSPLRPELGAMALSPEALGVLQAHRWPGNVRELEHAIERAVVLADTPVIGEEDLPDSLRARGRSPALGALGEDLSLRRAVQAAEAQVIRAALERTGGNRTRAAEILEISYRALLYKIKEYGLGV